MMLNSKIVDNEDEKKREWNELNKFFSSISLDDLKSKIRKYHDKKESIIENDVKNFFDDIFMIDLPGGFSFTSFNLTSFDFMATGKLFRVRAMTEELKDQLGQEKININELWEPPKKNAYQGRVNAEGQQYLYVSEANLDICVAEARIKENEFFILIVYQIVESFSVTGIGFDHDNPLPDPETNAKMQLISNAIKEIFLNTAENSYIYSNYIANHLCDFDMAGWSYPSVQSGKGMNICLKLTEKDKLKINTVLVCKYLPKLKERYHFFKTFEFIDGNQKCYCDWDSGDKSESKRIVFKETFIDPTLVKNNDRTTDEDRKKITFIEKYIHSNK
ncbi:RES domain-containing protein [Acinetobacter bereziniae]|uniref:RES domain-containing protein n=6 Tax=Acinetobacter bereziniae TaxID=106648 RepID=UPI001581124E|nr:RES domain-containing protein [Acinetobacter bereziniae]NUG71557.1 RES domain-containing protein [Acinetobacter bereziniae]